MKYNVINTLSTYEEVYNKLNNTLDEFLSNANNNYLKSLYYKSRYINNDNLENRLIETKSSYEQLVKKIKSSYLQRDYLKGHIGVISGKEQYDGILNISLYLLISNRLAYFYRSKISNNPYLDKSTKTLYNEKFKQYKGQKKDATIKLIYSLFIYTETVNDNDFFYGHSLDIDGFNDNDTFIIDLPKYSQIGIHFGSESRLRSITYLAKKNIQLILQEKLHLGQITQKQFNKLMSKVNDDNILPEYTGKFYENVAFLPINYKDKNFQKAKRILQLTGKPVTKIDNEDIKRISQDKYYNNRELHYFAVKSGFSKSQLELLSKCLAEKDKQCSEKSSKNPKENHIDITKLGTEAILLTDAQGRLQVSNNEKQTNFDFEHPSPKLIKGE